MGNCGTKKGVEAAGVTEPTTQVAPTLVEQGEGTGKVESVGEQVVEAAAEVKAEVAEVVEVVEKKAAEAVEGVEEKIAAVEEKVAETVAEVKEEIAEAAEKVEAADAVTEAK